MPLRALADAPVVSRVSELRLMDTENQIALTDIPLSGVSGRRDGSRSGWPDAYVETRLTKRRSTYL